MIAAKPILVVMVWRGGERFTRCLDSIAEGTQYFSKIVLSITSQPDSADMVAAQEFQEIHSNIEIICTGRELPTMQHQDFWVTHLENSGVKPSEWIYWLAYDDQIWPSGLKALTDSNNELHLDPKSVYFGPWAMRHEQPDVLWHGDESAPMETWTSFPENGPTKLPLFTWISDQLRQPTYMQMSGSVIPFANYLQLRDSTPKKSGPMRIEMATAAGSDTTTVSEFAEPVSVIYGRSNSDRANYGKAARAEDIHLMRYLWKRAQSRPSEIIEFGQLLVQQSMSKFHERFIRKSAPTEEWRIRGHVQK